MAATEGGDPEFAGEVVPPTPELITALHDPERPIAQRMRAIFYLRTKGGSDALDALCKALVDKRGSDLFRHELAYVLGQMQDVAAVPTLSAVLADKEDKPIVRHEAAEAIGAIGAPGSLALLEEYVSDPCVEVAETCQIAVARVKWSQEQAAATKEHDTARASASADLDKNPYDSVDPAPATGDVDASVEELLAAMNDKSQPLFDRYRAMFTLRNRGTEECVRAIAVALKDSSALFRHEAAYVLGQMQHPAAVEALRAVVVDDAEQGMVRHEAAEALGAIGGTDCVDLLNAYKADKSDVVRESCEVALDIADYWAPTAVTTESSTAPAAAGADAAPASGAGSS